MKKILILLALLLAIGQGAWAQMKVNGTVFTEDSVPLANVIVVVTGTNVVAETKADGKFSLNVPKGRTHLFISAVGYETQQIAAKSTMDIFLRQNQVNLNEVVVTAMGIKKEEKALGFSAQTLETEELTLGNLTDVTSSIAGKVAGVQINATSGDPGQANSVIIRGVSSINGNNQPLYVVDGVPLQSATMQAYQKQNAIGGISNINPNDIESMTVLKGAAATALYGSRAANGVIVINTKTGKKKGDKNYEISYDGSWSWRNVSILPKLQNRFGQGWNGQQTYIENGSWGPEMDGSQQVYGPIWNNQQLIHEYSPLKSNIRDFFKTGFSTSHSVALNGVSSDNRMTYYLSFSHSSDDGIIPGDKDTYKRNTLAYRGSYQATDWFKLSSSINLSTNKTDAVGQYQGVSMIDGILEFPRDISLVDRKDLSSAFNTPEAWYTPYGITNPYWAIANNYNHTDGKQVFGKVQADIQPIKQLTLTYRLGFDYTDYDVKYGEPQIDLDDALINEDYGYAPSEMNQTGNVYARYNRQYEINHDFLANWKDKYLDERLDVNLTAGLTITERKWTYMLGQTDDLTFHTGFWDLSNGATKTTISESQTKRRNVGLFGDLTLGWENMLYLGITARNDWSSTLPLKKNNYFYSGVTLSWIFTELMPKNDVLTFGKARLAYGKTGNDAGAYMVYPRYVQGFSNGYYAGGLTNFPFNGTNAFQAAATAGSNDLKPEMTTEFEMGLNLAFFNNRLNVDFSYYNRSTKDQIFTLPVDPATGYGSMVTNFGKVTNKGIELLVNTVPVQTRKLRWELGFNFAKNNNKVVSMPASLEGGMVNINSFSAGDDAVYMRAVEGKPMGELYTYMPQYTEDGKMIVDAYGQPLLTDEVMDTGKNVNPVWTGGVTTSLSAYGFTLSAAMDVRQGGYMFSRTKNLMQFTGNSDVTLYNERNPFIIPNSVYADGTENTSPIYLNNTSYQDYFNKYGAGVGGEFYLLKRSFVKLRNITLSYTLPKTIVRKLYLSDITLSLFANNLITWTHKGNRYIDPETSADGNDLDGMFGELYSNPACRTIGFGVSVKF
ncbi:MAG: SusC/RagA family TonB-linked outer membrane protein [Bacteroidaceae bacterium]|nr:SusC/RagA family TonB-linked outer membrane protein [Bacteroidaceae bacterium]